MLKREEEEEQLKVDVLLNTSISRKYWRQFCSWVCLLEKLTRLHKLNSSGNFAMFVPSVFHFLKFYSVCIQRSINWNKHAEIWVDKRFVSLYHTGTYLQALRPRAFQRKLKAFLKIGICFRKRQSILAEISLLQSRAPGPDCPHTYTGIDCPWNSWLPSLAVFKIGFHETLSNLI